MEAAQHNNALPTPQQQQCTAVGKLVAKYRIALQNRTLPMQALAIFACFDPTVDPWSADRESGVECFPILTDEESEAAGTGSAHTGRCGQPRSVPRQPSSCDQGMQEMSGTVATVAPSPLLYIW